MAQEEKRNVTIVINGKEVVNTISAISREYKKQSKDLATVQRGTKEYQDKLMELRKTKAILDEHARSIRNIGKAQKSGGLLGGLFGGGGVAGITSMLGPLATLSGLISTLVTSFNKIREFSSAMDELQAITGASGEDLEKLKKTALETGKVVGKSGSEMLEAYKLVGSAKPELLENIDLLTAFTDRAITLSHATKNDLSESAADLTAIMNANGASVAETDRYINALAAGSQKGAQEVGYLAEAMTKYGPAAAAAGLSIEQQVAAIETLGEKIPSASTAGTNFRNVLGILQKDTANYTNGVFDFNKALDNLAPIMNDNVALTEKFGVENAIAAQILAQNKGRYDELTEAVTGTNTAYEQAAINQDNLDGAISRFQAKFDAVILQFSEADGLITQIIDLAGDFVTLYDAAMKEVGAQFVYLFNAVEPVVDIFKQMFNVSGDNVKAIDFIRIAVKATFVPLKTLIALFTSLFEIGNFLASGMRVGLENVTNTIKEWANKAIGIINSVAEFVGFDGIDLKFDIVPNTESIDIEGTKKRLADIWGNVWTGVEEKNVETTSILSDQLKTQTQTLDTEVTKQKGILESLESEYDALGEAMKKATSVEELKKLQAEQAKIKAKMDMLKSGGGGGARMFGETMERVSTLGPDFEEAIDPVKVEENIAALKEEIALKSMQQINTWQKEFAEERTIDEMERAEEAANFQIELWKMGADLAHQIVSQGIDRDKEAQLAALEDQKERGIVNEREYQAKKEDIMRKAFMKQKAADIAQALINGALAVTKVTAQTGILSPFTIPLIVAQTAAQVGVIAAQKFEDGGQFLLNGPSHSNDGMPVINPYTGRKVAELEGGEYIIRKSAVNASTLPILNAINNSGSVDFAGMRVVKSYADGGQFTETAQNTAPGTDAAIIEEIRNLRADLNSYQREFKVVMSLREYDEAASRKEKVRKIAEIRA